MNLAAQRTNLIKQALWKWSNELPRAKLLLNLDSFDNIDSSDRDLICDVLIMEVANTGLKADSEPTDRGLELEATIDWIRSLPQRPNRAIGSREH